jgi:hypothetical protein
MKALVDEIRALRQTIERAAAQTGQAQLLLGRVQLQEARLAVLSRQYLDARSRSVGAQTEQTELEQQLRLLSDPLRNTAPEERLAIEDRTRQLKHALEVQQVRTVQLRSDETAAADALSSEQQRWADFNERLEALERTISSTAAPRP